MTGRKDGQVLWAKGKVGEASQMMVRIHPAPLNESMLQRRAPSKSCDTARAKPEQDILSAGRRVGRDLIDVTAGRDRHI